jgi:hypothetical protein
LQVETKDPPSVFSFQFAPSSSSSCKSEVQGKAEMELKKKKAKKSSAHNLIPQAQGQGPAPVQSKDSSGANGQSKDHSKENSNAKSNVSTHKDKHQKIHFEFGGPIGACGVIFGLPVVIYMLYFLCNDKVCMHDPRTFDWKSWFQNLPPLSYLFSWEASAMFLGWMALHVFLER